MSQFTMRKYVLSPLGEGEFTDMCKGEIFHVGQDPATGHIALWALHSPDYPVAVRRSFKAFGTGQPLPGSWEFWGTAIIDRHVWHVFEDTAPCAS
jgi:hypothetical protein